MKKKYIYKFYKIFTYSERLDIKKVHLFLLFLICSDAYIEPE